MSRLVVLFCRVGKRERTDRAQAYCGRWYQVYSSALAAAWPAVTTSASGILSQLASRTRVRSTHSLPACSSLCSAACRTGQVAGASCQTLTDRGITARRLVRARWSIVPPCKVAIMAPSAPLTTTPVVYVRARPVGVAIVVCSAWLPDCRSAGGTMVAVKTATAHCVLVCHAPIRCLVFCAETVGEVTSFNSQHVVDEWSSLGHTGWQHMALVQSLLPPHSI